MDAKSEREKQKNDHYTSFHQEYSILQQSDIYKTVLAALEHTHLTHLVWPSDQEVEQGYDGPLKLRPSPRVDCCRGKRLPYNSLTNVCGDEERDAWAQTIARRNKKKLSV